MRRNWKSLKQIHRKSLVGALLSLIIGILISGMVLVDSYLTLSNNDNPWYQGKIPFVEGLFLGIGLTSFIILIFVFTEKNQ